MRLFCMSTRIIQHAGAPPPARFDYDYADLARHRREDGYDDGADDLQSATSGF
jgi:hypothetical protein